MSTSGITLPPCAFSARRGYRRAIAHRFGDVRITCLTVCDARQRERNAQARPAHSEAHIEHPIIGGRENRFLQAARTKSTASTIFLADSIPWSKTNSSPSCMMTTACFNKPFLVALTLEISFRGSSTRASPSSE